MRRILVGAGTALGNYLAANDGFHHAYSYARALAGISTCDEIVLVAPGLKRLACKSLGVRMGELLNRMRKADARMIVLSSIDVYPSKGLPLNEAAPAVVNSLNAGLVRFEVDALAMGATVLRLPETFGSRAAKGLCRHLIARDANAINRVGIHQWYPLYRLQHDISVARSLGARTVNLCSEPLPMRYVMDKLFPTEIGHVQTPAPYSRIKSLHAEAFGGANGYIMSANDVLEALCLHVRAARRRQSKASGATSLPAKDVFLDAHQS